MFLDRQEALENSSHDHQQISMLTMDGDANISDDDDEEVYNVRSR